MTRYSIKLETRKYVKGFEFLSFLMNLYTKYGQELLDAGTKIGLNPLLTTYKEVAHKADEVTGEFVGNKMADKIVKTKPLTAENSKNFKETIIPP